MEINNSFEVAAPPPQVWDLLLDVERIAPCMPGAELTEVVDERTWRGRVRMRIGPVSLNYTGQVVIEERDDDAMTVTLRAEGAEVSGKGQAAAKVRSRVEATADGGSRVLISNDLALAGMAAQFGGRMIADVSNHLTQQFATCLGAKLASPDRDDAMAPPATPRELPGLRLAFWALFRALGRLLRLSGRRDNPNAAGRRQP